MRAILPLILLIIGAVISVTVAQFRINALSEQVEALSVSAHTQALIGQHYQQKLVALEHELATGDCR